MKQEFENSSAVHVTMGPYFLYQILLIRSFISSEINTFGLHKLSKTSFAFNIFVPIPVQEMFYSKAIKKSPRWTFLCLEPSIKKRI